MMEQACTAILVGKKGPVDGSPLIARYVDTFLPITPQRFVMQPAVSGRKEPWTSNKNGFTAPLQSEGYRTTFTPNADVEKNGVFGETSINEKNVAMSATESVYG